MRLVDLDDPLARDPGFVGAKAARLALARRAGLPALPGVVVPIDVGRPVIAAAAQALRTGGTGAARLAALAVDIDEGLLSALRAALVRLGEPVVARSSSPLEADGVWAGAFSSYEDVGVADLRAAVRGVWASAFTVHALERCEAAGVDPAEVELGVLVQPQVRPACGGSARVDPDGAVAVQATKGSPRDLMGGWEVGLRARVTLDGRVEGDEAVAQLGEPPLRAAADLARRVREALGDDLVEWAWSEGGIVLLQASSLPAPPVVSVREDPHGLDHPLALRVARLAARFPGPLGEALVLPWALSLPAFTPRVAAAPADDPPQAFARATALSAELAADVWQAPPERARREAAAAFSALRGPQPGAAFERLGRLQPVDPARGETVVALLDSAAAALVARGRLSDPQRLWRRRPSEAEALAQGRGVNGVAEPARVGPDRWEPFVHGAVRAHGVRSSGLPVVPGVAAGRVVVIRNPHAPPPIRDRDVVVAERPLPALSPLLWTASALVTASGNPAAHLFEVAAALGVPTVLGVDLDPFGGLAGLGTGTFLGAVEGREGRFAAIPA